MFLSSLRVFAHLTGVEASNEQLRDSVLHVIHLLTGFPPAVRTMHILASGNTPTPQERAALCQSMYEVVKSMIPPNVIGFESSRFFEGSRLLFGLLLEKSKNFKLGDDGLLFPYITAMKTVSLTNSETTEPISFPVDTNVGLLERGCFEALNAGIIQYADPELASVIEVPLDGRTKRAALLSDGSAAEITVFDMNVLYANERFDKYANSELMFSKREMTDMNHLAVLSSRHQLSIVSPDRLGSAPHPVLTLDRHGLGAVYLGRQACGQPGKDFLIFCPTRGGECTIDIAIVTQLLTPILASREADGSAVLDSIGDPMRRRVEVPDELLMICVDCSTSMREPAGFEDIALEEREPRQNLVQSPSLDQIQDVLPGSLEDVKEEISAHEAFNDVVHTTKAVRHDRQQNMALNLVQLLVDLKREELEHWLRQISDMRQRVFWTGLRTKIEKCEERVLQLKQSIVSINHHKDSLVDFIIFRARYLEEETMGPIWHWRIGDSVPSGLNGSLPDLPSSRLGLAIPQDYLCPMTHELFNDPVVTEDGHTYERSAIRQWFQIRKTSPMTGLVLENSTLRTNRVMTRNVREWVRGDAIINTSKTRPGTSRLRSVPISKTLKIQFLSSQDTFKREVREDMPVSALYDLAFRGLKGRFPNFSLQFLDKVLDADDATLGKVGLRDESVVHIAFPEASLTGRPFSQSGSSSETSADTLCLVKVFSGDCKTLLFSFWTAKNTKESFGSIVFKYWRFRAETGHFREAPSKKRVRYNLQDLGDGWFSGHTSSSWEALSNYLTPWHARGFLGDETAYADAMTSSSGSVLGLMNNNIFDWDGPFVNDSHGNAPGSSVTPLVFKVLLTRPTVQKESRAISRLSVLKQMFDQFVNRILAYNYRTHIGLITFNSTARVAQPLTHIIEDFRSTVNRLDHSGDTALWDALALAGDQIMEHANKYPNAKRRILCISDGLDTKSVHMPAGISDELCRNDIYLDCFCLAEDDNSDLQAISYLTKGYNFIPKTLEAAMAICEMEPVLSLSDRDIEDIESSRRSELLTSAGLFNFSSARWLAEPEVVTKDVFPKRKSHPNLGDQFIELVTAIPRRVLSASDRTDSNFRTTRLLTEARSLAANPHPHYDVFVSERDISFWKIIMEGPPESIYADGTFVLYLHMENDYPTFAPKCRFITPIYHPNINRHGRVCHSIFDRNWTTDTSNAMVLSTVYGLLFEPDYSDPV
jgi:ubiquitin-protein ligase/uncharacterized protein YegL